VTEAIRKLSGQDYVDEYAQKVKARLQAQESPSDTAEHETH
jgi:hypothetical protein